MERFIAKHPEDDERDVFKDLAALSVGEPSDTPRKIELQQLMTLTNEDVQAALRIGGYDPHA
jgi:hypothetical protein